MWHELLAIEIVEASIRGCTNHSIELITWNGHFGAPDVSPLSASREIT